MAILTLAELKQAFDAERVTDLASDYNSVQSRVVYDETILENIISQAEDFVKASLSKQYSVAQLEADKSVERFTADIAMYYLESRRNQFTPSVERAFERAQRIIQSLQDGTAKLGAVAQVLPRGNTEVPTEVLELGQDFFKLNEDEDELLGLI